MDFNSISMIHSQSQSTIIDEVSLINHRMSQAQNRINALNSKSKSSIKVFEKSSILFQHNHTKRSNLTYQGLQTVMQRQTLPIKMDKRSCSQYMKQTRKQPIIKDIKTQYQQRIYELLDELDKRNKQIEILKQKEYQKGRQANKRYIRNQQRLSNQLEQLRKMIKQQIDRSSKLQEQNVLNKRIIKQLLEKNNKYEMELESLLLNVKSNNKQIIQQTVYRNNSQRENEQQLSYRVNLFTHYKQCLILCQFLTQCSEVLSRLKTAEIPATAVMIRQKLNSNLPMVQKVAQRIIQLCPDAFKDKQIISKRKQGLLKRKYIGDQKQNIDTNRTGTINSYKNSNPSTSRKEPLLNSQQELMQLLLIQAQTLEQCI